jgi:ATP-dependent RNA helicase RhlE
VHRIGRTGRAGSSGEAISLVCVDEHRLLRDIERLLKKDIEKRVVAGFEPDPRIRPEPIQNGRGGRQAPRNGASSGQRNGAPAGGQRNGASSGQRKPQRPAAPGAGHAAPRRNGGSRQGARYS